MKNIRNLGEKPSLVSQFLSEIRDKKIQQDRLRFRKNMERLGEIIAYEISKELEWQVKEVETPLGIAHVPVLRQQPIIATILRAGLALHSGLLNFFDRADNAFISAFRKHDENGNFTIKLDYISCPRFQNRILIVSDPMLATGKSMVLTLKALLEYGKPRHIHIVSAIASEEGVQYLKDNLDNFTLWTGAIDPVLNDRAYIVPGLGDAGDLAFGEKIQN